MENQSKVVVVERNKFAALVKYFQSCLFKASFCKHCAQSRNSRLLAGRQSPGVSYPKEGAAGFYLSW